jgi:hypothetical protein
LDGLAAVADEALDGGLSLNIFRPAEFPEMRLMPSVVCQRTFLDRRQTNGLSLK